jgi:hypothetical protein
VATQALPLSRLMPEAIPFLNHLLLVSNRSSEPLASDSTDGDGAADDSSYYVAYSPLVSAASLSLQVEQEMPADNVAGAQLQGESRRQSDNIGSTLSSPNEQLLLGLLVLLALLPLLFYRRIPARFALLADRFSWLHKVDVGGTKHNRPTQWGAAVTLAFLFCALLLAVMLATQHNLQYSTALLPPSAVSGAGSATARIELTIRAHLGASTLMDGVSCPTVTRARRMDHSTLVRDEGGFTQPFEAISAPVLASGDTTGVCVLSLICASCGVAGTSAFINVSLPLSAQLLEWELAVSAADPGVFARRYGVLLPPSSRLLLSAESLLRFSVTESFFEDHTPASRTQERRSGFELAFNAYESLRTQSPREISASARVGLSFVLDKSSAVYETILSNKFTLLQQITSIASSLVTLLSVFGFLFIATERGLLPRWKGVPGTVCDERNKGGGVFILEDAAKGVTTLPQDKYGNEGGKERKGHERSQSPQEPSSSRSSPSPRRASIELAPTAIQDIKSDMTALRQDVSELRQVINLLQQGSSFPPLVVSPHRRTQSSTSGAGMPPLSPSMLFPFRSDDIELPDSPAGAPTALASLSRLFVARSQRRTVGQTAIVPEQVAVPRLLRALPLAPLATRAAASSVSPLPAASPSARWLMVEGKRHANEWAKRQVRPKEENAASVSAGAVQALEGASQMAVDAGSHGPLDPNDTGIQSATPN